MFSSNALVSRSPARAWRVGLQALLLTGAACLAAGQARAQSNDELADKAATGHWADVGSTGVGLAMGAAEANPLGLLTLGVKAIAYQQIKEAPALEQPRMWSAYGAFGWGATANNLCIIATIASGGAAAALCPVLGVAAGVSSWNLDKERRERAEFDAICDEVRKENPKVKCVYTLAPGS